MKAIFYLIILLLFISCSEHKSSKKIDWVAISEVIITDDSTVSDVIKIQAKAEATNGCWSNLYFEIEKINEFEYLLSAFGTFETNGVCPAVMVYKDTLIEFIPEKKGMYLFKITEKPNQISIDTLIIK